jgi:hypothetical protein
MEDWQETPEKGTLIAAVLNLATNQWIIKSVSEVQRGDLSKLFYQMGHDGLSCEKIHVCNQDDAKARR